MNEQTRASRGVRRPGPQTRHDPRVAGPGESPLTDDDVVAALHARGLPPEAITWAMRRGDPDGAIFGAVLTPAIAERTVSALEIERRRELSVGDVQAFVAALGLRPPAPEQPAFTPGQRAGRARQARRGLAGRARSATGRVWGALLARIAQAGVQLLRGRAEPPLRSDDSDRPAGLHATQQTFARLLPLADPVLVGVYHRWIEHGSRKPPRPRQSHPLEIKRSPAACASCSCSAT